MADGDILPRLRVHEIEACKITLMIESYAVERQIVQRQLLVFKRVVHALCRGPESMRDRMDILGPIVEIGIVLIKERICRIEHRIFG